MGDVPTGVSEKSALEDESKKRRGGGGAWRAFQSLHTRGSGQKLDWASLSQDYQHAKQQKTPDYQQAHDVGRAAAIRHPELRGEDSPPEFGGLSGH